MWTQWIQSVSPFSSLTWITMSFVLMTSNGPIQFKWDECAMIDRGWCSNTLSPTCIGSLYTSWFSLAFSLWSTSLFARATRRWTYLSRALIGMPYAAGLWFVSSYGVVWVSQCWIDGQWSHSVVIHRWRCQKLRSRKIWRIQGHLSIRNFYLRTA